LDAAGGELAGVGDGLMQAGLEELDRREFGEVFADADGFGIELEQLHLLGIGGGTENEAEGDSSPGARSCLSSQRR
jgi:hypothetical protein